MNRNTVRLLFNLSVLTLSACTDDDTTSRENPISQGGNGGATAGHAGTAANGGRGGRAGRGGEAGRAATVTVGDPEIAAVLQAANAAEVRQNTVGANRTETQAVRELAVDFANAHAAANSRLLGVLLDQDIEPAENTTSRHIWRTSERTVQKLHETSPSEFDTVFLQSQIDAHKTVLETIDKTLTPAVKNAALKTELQTERSAVKEHLQRAEALAKTLELDVDAGAAEDGGT